MNLLTLLAPLTPVARTEVADREISAVVYDSRRIVPGCLFVCIPGLKHDGHAFAASAAAGGAAALVVEHSVDGVPPGVPVIQVPNGRQALALLAAQWYGQPARKLIVVGVTGTNGKTTTTHLLRAILEAAGLRTGIVGTLYAQFGDLTIPAKHTTPESLELQQALAAMAAAGAQAVVMEISSHALALDRAYGLPMDVGVFTNLTQDHLDFHRTMEEYFEAKVRLFTALGTQGKQASAVVNLDDPCGRKIDERVSVPVWTYGLSTEARVHAVDIAATPHGALFTAITPAGIRPFQLQLGGVFNVYNALAAISAGLALNLDLDHIREGLESVQGVRGRFEPVRGGREFSVVVDYAHTPDGLKNVLTAARALAKGRLIVVFGCGGDRDKGKRPMMGRIAAELSDLVVLTADNPRSEDPARIIREIEVGVRERTTRHVVELDRRKAIELALREARPGDIVLLAGKGHETYQIFKDRTDHFDDAEVASELLRTLVPAGTSPPGRRSAP